MFKRLVDSNLDPSTPFRSLAHRLNMQLLKTRKIPASECCFLLQGLQLYKSSHSFHKVSLKVGSRQLYVNETDAEEMLLHVPKQFRMNINRGGGGVKFSPMKRNHGYVVMAVYLCMFKCTKNVYEALPTIPTHRKIRWITAECWRCTTQVRMDSEQWAQVNYTEGFTTVNNRCAVTTKTSKILHGRCHTHFKY